MKIALTFPHLYLFKSTDKTVYKKLSTYIYKDFKIRNHYYMYHVN